MQIKMASITSMIIARPYAILIKEILIIMALVMLVKV